MVKILKFEERGKSPFKKPEGEMGRLLSMAELKKQKGAFRYKPLYQLSFREFLDYITYMRGTSGNGNIEKVNAMYLAIGDYQIFLRITDPKLDSAEFVEYFIPYEQIVESQRRQARMQKSEEIKHKAETRHYFTQWVTELLEDKIEKEMRPQG